MKVWITRPRCDEVFMGGLRNVLLWVDKPYFDQRPIIEEYELYDPDTKEYGPGVWREGGWTSTAGAVRAKPFLKQSEAVKERVWELIRESLVSDELELPVVTAFESGDILLDIRYEAKCAVSWKRFLLEIDLATEEVSRVQVRVLMSGDVDGVDLPLTPEIASTSHFLDEDLNRPFSLKGRPGKFELRDDRIW